MLRAESSHFRPWNETQVLRQHLWQKLHLPATSSAIHTVDVDSIMEDLRREWADLKDAIREGKAMNGTGAQYQHFSKIWETVSSELLNISLRRPLCS